MSNTKTIENYEQFKSAVTHLFKENENLYEVILCLHQEGNYFILNYNDGSGDTASPDELNIEIHKDIDLSSCIVQRYDV